MPDTKIPTARDWMTPVRLTLPANLDIVEAIERLIDREVTAAMVVDEHDKLLGILTDKDCLRVLSHAIYENQEHPATVKDFMSPATVLEPDMDFFRVVEQFLGCHFPTLPVVKDGVLMGRIGRKDVLQGIQRFLTTKAAELRKMLQQPDGSERPSSIEEMQRAAADHDPESLARRFTQNR